MGIFGRETAAERQCAEQVRIWFQARSPYAVASVALGLAASVDVLTIVLGACLGTAAICCGIAGLRDLRRRPELLGRRLCVGGIALGCVGVTLSLIVWAWVAAHRHGAGG